MKMASKQAGHETWERKAPGEAALQGMLPGRAPPGFFLPLLSVIRESRIKL